MTTPDHMRRVRALAANALAWEAQDTTPVCPIDKPCSCPTCGVTTLLVRSALRKKGYSEEDQRRVTLIGNDFRGGQFHLASLRVDGNEVFRLETSPDEALREDVLQDIGRALRKAS